MPQFGGAAHVPDAANPVRPAVRGAVCRTRRPGRSGRRRARQAVTVGRIYMPYINHPLHRVRPDRSRRRRTGRLRTTSPKTGYMYVCSKDSSVWAWKALPKAQLTKLLAARQLLPDRWAVPACRAVRAANARLGKVVAMDMPHEHGASWVGRRSPLGDMCHSGILTTEGRTGVRRTEQRATGRPTRRLLAASCSGSLPQGQIRASSAPAIRPTTVHGKQYVAVYAGGNSIAAGSGTVKVGGTAPTCTCSRCRPGRGGCKQPHDDEGRQTWPSFTSALHKWPLKTPWDTRPLLLSERFFRCRHAIVLGGLIFMKKRIALLCGHGVAFLLGQPLRRDLPPRPRSRPRSKTITVTAHRLSFQTGWRHRAQARRSGTSFKFAEQGPLALTNFDLPGHQRLDHGDRAREDPEPSRSPSRKKGNITRTCATSRVTSKPRDGRHAQGLARPGQPPLGSGSRRGVTGPPRRFTS